jgi:hypothetical protein
MNSLHTFHANNDNIALYLENKRDYLRKKIIKIYVCPQCKPKGKKTQFHNCYRYVNKYI